MPRRKRKGKSSSKSHTRETASRRETKTLFDLKPETSRAILAVLVFVLALISLLSVFRTAGTFGHYWVHYVSLLFGIGVYVMPLLLIALAFAILNLKKFPTKTTTYLGFILFVIGFVGLAHLAANQDQALDIASRGTGGGFIGYGISRPLYLLFGSWGALVILIADVVISLLLFFNESIKLIMEKIRMADKELDDEDEEEDEEVKSASVLAKTSPKMRILDFKDKVAGKKKEDNVKILEMKDKDKTESFGPAVETKKNRDINWEFPPLKLLDDALDRPSSGDIKTNAKIIQETLANFGINVEMGDVSVGPTVTQYTLRPDAGTKLSKIVALQNDLALALAAHPIRIEAPIPGKSVVGIEIPNVTIATVRLRELLESKEYAQAKGDLLFPLGRDVSGMPIISMIEKMPHLLIAGATGSGKSVAINAMLISLLYHNTPEDLKLILVDPKRVELSHYNDIPHLLTPVITEPKKTVNSLKWIVGEMDRRYKLLQAHGVRNIQGFNEKNTESHLPKIVLVIDELADLMSVAAREVEASIVRLAQMARAVGIHLVVATQRPSVDVITGLIKANIPTRIAFSVASSVDSRTILDTVGADKLLGNGDMLYLPQELSKPRRIQGAFVTDGEVEKVTDFLKNKREPDYVEEVTAKQGSVPGIPGSGDEADDDLYSDAKQIVIESGKASASLLQRRLRVGYARAARLIDLLEQNGVVGPGEGAKPRDILIGQGGEELATVSDGGGFDAHEQDDAADVEQADNTASQEKELAQEEREEREAAEQEAEASDPQAEDDDDASNQDDSQEDPGPSSRRDW
jgi:S-DNA-T family DNA segregation ATPase FtsK/SpoIIIE